MVVGEVFWEGCGVCVYVFIPSIRKCNDRGLSLNSSSCFVVTWCGHACVLLGDDGPEYWAEYPALHFISRHSHY